MYIDGFNLYNGLKAKHGGKYNWLDLEALVRRLLKPDQTLVGLRYFTASVRDDPSALQRQSSYLGALGTHCPGIEIIMGRFQEKKARCRSCGSEWKTFEEKETDVNLAIRLLEDGINNEFDVALLISADSDLCPPVRALKRIRPRAQVIAFFPPKRRSDELRRTVDAALTIPDRDIRNSLLPDTVRRGDGVVYTRPRSWR